MMDPHALLTNLSKLMWQLVADELDRLKPTLDSLDALVDETEPALKDRLLQQLSQLPDGGALLDLVHDIVGDTPGALAFHGWKRTDGTRGIALVVTAPVGRAVLAFAPGPVVDVFVKAGTDVSLPIVATADWNVTVDLASQSEWNATLVPNDPAPPAAVGSAALTVTRNKRVTLGAPQGPGAFAESLTTTIRVGPGEPLGVTVSLVKFEAAVLPAALASMLGASSEASAGPSSTPVTVRADRSNGIRFSDGGVQLNLPLRLNLPAVSTRNFAVRLDSSDSGFALTPSLDVHAQLPGLPISAVVNGIAVSIPVDVGVDGIGARADVQAPMPSGIGVSLALPPVSGGGAIIKRPNGSYGGVLDIDLGIVAVKAVGVLQLEPLSFLVLLGLQLPYPGIQLGFGFALDAVGGIVGVNRRIDVEHLRGLVSDGNSDRILFPGNDVASRADEITRSLDNCFPVARGRFVVGPMVRINWGGRLVTVAAAVLLDLPLPARVVLLGRVVVAVPDPAAPLILLQASIFGRIDPGIPLIEFLVSLNGSWIVGYPLTGQIYVLFRGGADPVFVLAAGGFHPRYQRPNGVPQLERIGMNLGGGILRLRAEAYLALTSNSLQFGAKLQLDATIAGCGVEGNLGLDALFVWEPVLFFTVHVYAGVAVLAFGRRLASVGLDFTLEGPGEWHAFGTGSISVLFWDVSLDFDVRWGDKRTLTPHPADILPELTTVVARHDSWTVERKALRSAVRLTATAAKDLADGALAQPDSTLALNQSVVPLNQRITRFHRVAIPEQEWEFTQVSLGGDPVSLDRPLNNVFVPGEFFALSEDEQLVASAFADFHGGFALTERDVTIEQPRLADDTYETSYEVDDDWFAPDDRDRRLIRSVMKAEFHRELWARTIVAAERVDRWRVAQAMSPAPMVVTR